MFNSTASHFQNPNPNPNCDQIFTNYSVDRLNDSTYFEDIANFLMSNEDEESSGENVSLKNMDVSRNATFDGSLNSIPLAHNMREVKKPERQKGCRFAFRTKTDLEFMDDGFKWRKYGKKMVKNSPNPRNYFKCSSGGCIVKKRVERDAEDSRYVITTYDGIHNHESPSCVLYCSPQASSLLHASSI